ncbi:MAG: Rne/Rng family ribonuclease [Rhodospirillales bacterium]|nr:Rne/Rng family ribonuclease [Rhodospirillales bacterium]
MKKFMLIDASDPAETRIVVTKDDRVEEFDREIGSYAQLKGNIYLAKVTRVEPSLQAAFVDYGGNRHGFLPFSEIHPDYYRIPVADREALLAEEAAIRAAAEAGNKDDEEPVLESAKSSAAITTEIVETGAGEPAPGNDEEASAEPREAADAPQDWDGSEADPEEAAPVEGSNSARSQPMTAKTGDQMSETQAETQNALLQTATEEQPETPTEERSAEADFPTEVEIVETQSGVEADRSSAGSEAVTAEDIAALADTEVQSDSSEAAAAPTRSSRRRSSRSRSRPDTKTGTEAQTSSQKKPESKTEIDGAQEAPEAREAIEEVGQEIQVETLDGDDIEDAARRRAKLLRRYKIQEVIKRGQIMLAQVSKEERGNKGAALTTYLSLPGRYCVLMPNTARGGGISRRISSSSDRRRLKDILSELKIPDGMAVIVRTAGSERSKIEIRRDYDYLIRLWSQIRQSTLQAKAPALIYEEGNIIKRAIRDLYTSDTDEILVEGENGYKIAKAFMRNLIPSHARKVQLYKERSLPLFQKYKVEPQLSGMFLPEVQLRSGGYLVINVTEALVAIDVNSGRATRERHIKETALKTNLEAAEEVAKQLQLRDLAGLIVIDFIDMEENRHNRDVERRLKDAMKTDRARIQLGRISPFGLLELSRQRLRPSLVETAMMTCAHCGGTGRLYSPETAAMSLLRAIVEEGGRRYGGEMVVTVPKDIALYLLNHKRARLTAEEERFGLALRIEVDAALSGLQHRIERIGGSHRPPPQRKEEIETRAPEEQKEALVAESKAAEEPPKEQSEAYSEGDSRRRRRRGRRGGRRRSHRPGEETQEATDEVAGEEEALEVAEEQGGAVTAGVTAIEISDQAHSDGEAQAPEDAAAIKAKQEAASKAAALKSLPEESASSESPVLLHPEETGAGALESDKIVPEEEWQAKSGSAGKPSATDETTEPEPKAGEPQVAEPGSPAIAAADLARPKRQGWWNRLDR